MHPRRRETPETGQWRRERNWIQRSPRKLTWSNEIKRRVEREGLFPISACISCRCRTKCNPPRPANLLMRFHYNFNVTIKTREEPHESVNRIFSEVAFEHPRHL